MKRVSNTKRGVCAGQGQFVGGCRHADANGRKAPSLVLLHHIDVVTANADYWRVDPFSGDKVDGYIYAWRHRHQGFRHYSVAGFLH